MLNLNQIADLRTMVTRGSEPRKALQQFIDAQRMHCVEQMVTALRDNKNEDARKFAFVDQAYEEMLTNMEAFVSAAERQ